MNARYSGTGIRGLVVAALFGALALGSSAVPAAESSSAGITVNYADLDVATPSGALVLYGRIRTAAHSACSYFWFKTDADEARCLQKTIAKAVTRLDQPALSAVYNAQYKASPPVDLVSRSR